MSTTPSTGQVDTDRIAPSPIAGVAGDVPLPEDLATLVAAAAEQFADRAPAGWPAPRGGRPSLPWLTEVAAYRAQHDAAALLSQRASGAPVPEVQSVRYQQIPLPAAADQAPSGAAQPAALTGRVYRPNGAGPHPAILVFHGGAFWMGGGATGFALNDALCRELCAGANAVVVNVDYRLAPEFAWPAQTDDGAAALRWVHRNASELNVDPQRVAVLGISSGGHLAASLATRLVRQHGAPGDGELPPLAAQFLMAPALDVSLQRAATTDAERAELTALLSLYFAPDFPRGVDVDNPEVSPGYAPPSGLPPTVLIAGDFDPVSAQCRPYAEKLAGAGVPVTLLRYPMTHTVATPQTYARVNADLVAQARRLLAR
ncbi:alpha/beta hydrolase [Nakamurella aerolata]|uniref:Alpha/beta hydrolase fold domain-containing protein n=1 Tax=Nakamurella aerolata TaxID=1656892 RepID=A0A849A9S7_9ACTN|nr:alpha/beta hydrolase [Nakamurella aerolata]NNG36727.1 alpha/beta hydrolase fold domain-containing protein [Nakamurella aerolata]